MKRETPRDTRFPYSRRGELNDKGTRFPCLIQDISVKGLFIICARNPVVGQELGVKFELTPGHIHQCQIRVQHIDNGCFGAEITNAGEHEDQVFQQFIQKRFKELKSHQSTE
jgi:hypothetical protein